MTCSVRDAAAGCPLPDAPPGIVPEQWQIMAGQARTVAGTLEQAEVNRLYWRSRRGMAELELQLLPFFEQRFGDLPDEQQAAYAALLAFEDWDIYDWLSGRAEPAPEVAEIVEIIRSSR